jgi:hypothetical protein
VSGLQLVDVAATDNIPINRAEVRLNGLDSHYNFLGHLLPSPYGWLFFWNTAGVPNGKYALRSIVYDADGRIAQSKPIVVSVEH